MSIENSSQSTSLSVEFNKAETLFLSIESSSLPSTDPQYLSQLQTAIQQCEFVWELVQRADLVSKNEVIDDVMTSSLRYLRIPYYIAVLYTKVSPQTERLNALQQALKMFRIFLDMCIQLRLMQTNDVKYYKSLVKDESHNDSALDVQTLRTMKIERFKRQKEAKLKLSELQKLQTTEMKKINESENKTEVINEEDEEEEEEVVREIELLKLTIAMYHALDELSLVTQEVTLLQHAQKQMTQQQNQHITDEKHHHVERESQTHRRPLIATKITSVNGRLVATPVVIDSTSTKSSTTTTTTTSSSSSSSNITQLPVPIASRLQMQQEVFQPGWIQPTLTVEQAAEIEMQFQAKGSMSKSSSTTQHQHQHQPTTNENDEDHPIKSDDEDAPDYDTRGVYKKREWDDWKDDNPRGWGNTGNKGYIY